VLPAGLHPADLIQIEREGLRIPGLDRVESELVRQGWDGEAQCFADALMEAESE
jgi:hypothetical protein